MIHPKRQRFAAVERGDINRVQCERIRNRCCAIYFDAPHKGGGEAALFEAHRAGVLEVFDFPRLLRPRRRLQTASLRQDHHRRRQASTSALLTI
ncbi:hypothetical protein [Caballeronia fortuita]|uniref:hypothetical protein n=1 Tax=Caballeronia fortuita TaxID=1777138 RepID=UPI0012FD3BDE|nr:hypothetical protein [Caballeronia fortuita]